MSKGTVLIIIPSSIVIAIQCSDTVGWVTGRHTACKKLVVGNLVVTDWLELCTSYTCSCQHHLHHP